MTIVYAAAASHAPGITAWPDAADKKQFRNVENGFEVLRKGLEAAKPEVLLLLTSEHWANYFLDHIGAFCVGRAEAFEGPIEPWLGVERRKMTGDPAFSTRLLEYCYANGFEPSHAHEMKIDHGTMVPLQYLDPQNRYRIVPVMFNTLAPPRPSPARCLALGQTLKPFLDKCPERVGVIATGGMSHDPGEVNHGTIDTDFDAKFLEQMAAADLTGLGKYDDSHLLNAGAGTLELLAWICLAGIMGNRGANIVTYEAIAPWSAGIGMVEYASA